MAHELERLSRRIAGGDLVAAKRAVAILEGRDGLAGRFESTRARIREAMTARLTKVHERKRRRARAERAAGRDDPTYEEILVALLNAGEAVLHELVPGWSTSTKGILDFFMDELNDAATEVMLRAELL